MSDAPVIHIAAAVLLDEHGRMAVVRKRGTPWFMQPGGKIAPGETPIAALLRELDEELGLRLPAGAFSPLGQFVAPAANEPKHTVHAELFYAFCAADLHPAAEIDACLRMTPDEGRHLPLAPLTRHAVLPLLARLSFQTGVRP